MPIVRFINRTPVGLIDHVLWSFGDGSDSTAINPPDHIYPPGYFNVSLTAWYAPPLQQETKTEQITSPGYLYPDFSYVQNGAAQVNFTNLTVNTVLWDWDFGDGSPHGTVANPEHTYSSAADYTVTLSVNGGYALTSKVLLLRPEANFSYTVVDTTTVNFIDTSIKFPSSWSWNFGDGSSSSVQNPSHIYQAPGIYPVTLTVNGDSTRTRSVNTSPSYPLVSFTRPEYSPGTIDIVSPALHMARGNTRGIFNAVTETSYERVYSPADTLWSNPSDTALDPLGLSYFPWEEAVYYYPGLYMVGKYMYMHILSEDSYYEVIFTSWTQGAGSGVSGGGGFSYTRQRLF